MKNRFRMFVVFAMLLALTVFSKPARSQMPGLDMTAQFSEILGQVLPPYIGDVTMEPEQPASDEDVTVSASISMIQVLDAEVPDISEAMLYYTTDGGETWEQEDMEQSDEEEIWTAVIPGQESGTTVDFYIKAINDVGIINIEMMDREIDLDVGDSQALEISESNNIGESVDPDNVFENLFLIAEDDESDAINPATDFRELRFGSDNDNIFFRLKFSKKIDGGRIAPLDANVYLGVLLNISGISRETLEELIRKLFKGDMSALSSIGVDRFSAWFYAPVAEALPPLPGVGKIPKEAILKISSADGKTPIFNKTGFDSKIQEDGTVDISIERDLIGDEITQLVCLFMVINATGNIPDVQGSLPDMSFPTLLKLTPHKYTVE